ncbi:MAG TPA: Gfo/Idh/MocA family oxidoreductase [Pseudolysinimonas sp.]|nr:Gfo/Idh/MocA family oxidoreductase [Pseudolysinimonas sp.]
MADTLRWGILGTGMIAELMTADLQRSGRAVTAVGSRSADAATAFAGRLGIPVAHGSYAALVSDPTVDVVYVATPHPFHESHALLAIDAGKHVLVEKPFTINAVEAQTVVDAAKAAGVVVLEAMWTRWLPHMVRIREIVASGVLGQLRTLHADHTQKLSLEATHRLQDPMLGGGALLDLGIYPISFAWDLFGAPTTVQAHSLPTATGVDRQTSVVFGYADSERNPGGAQAVLHAESDAAGPTRATVIGTDARIEIDGMWYTPTSFRVVNPAGEVIEFWQKRVEGRGMHFQADELEALAAAGALSGTVLPLTETVAIMASMDEVRAQIGLSYPFEGSPIITR